MRLASELLAVVLAKVLVEQELFSYILPSLALDMFV